MGREYFCAYHSFLEILTPYGDAECGRLFRAALKYSATGEEEEFRGNERFIWPTLKAQIDRDTRSYAEACSRKRESGAKGGRPKKADGFSENHMVFPETEKTKGEGEGKGKGKGEDEGKGEGEGEYYGGSAPARAELGREDLLPEIAQQIPERQEDGFDRFWNAFPRRSGDIREAFVEFEKAVAEGATVEEMLAALDWQAKEWAAEGGGGRFIPSPVRWLRNKRWKEQPRTPAQKNRGYMTAAEYQAQPAQAVDMDGLQDLLDHL